MRARACPAPAPPLLLSPAHCCWGFSFDWLIEEELTFNWTLYWFSLASVDGAVMSLVSTFCLGSTCSFPEPEGCCFSLVSLQYRPFSKTAPPVSLISCLVSTCEPFFFFFFFLRCCLRRVYCLGLTCSFPKFHFSICLVSTFQLFFFFQRLRPLVSRLGSTCEPLFLFFNMALLFRVDPQLKNLRMWVTPPPRPSPTTTKSCLGST